MSTSSIPQPRAKETSPAGLPRVGYVKELQVRYRFRRLPRHVAEIGSRVFSSVDAYRLLKGLRYETREHIVVLHLNSANRLISMEHVAVGTPTECPCSPAVIFRGALLAGATAIIVVHNHPSGEPTPSQADDSLMKRLCQAGQLVGITVLDFIILGDRVHWSGADCGLLVDGKYLQNEAIGHPGRVMMKRPPPGPGPQEDPCRPVQSGPKPAEEPWSLERALERLSRRPRLPESLEKDKQILELAQQGLSRAEIAAKLGFSYARVVATISEALFRMPDGRGRKQKGA